MTALPCLCYMRFYATLYTVGDGGDGDGDDGDGASTHKFEMRISLSWPLDVDVVMGISRDQNIKRSNEVKCEKRIKFKKHRNKSQYIKA